MMSAEEPEAAKKTPSDASEFEREQLRFFLSSDDIATLLASINPSLAWLPILQDMRLIKGESQLVAWIERNFSDVQAIRDVVSNIHFFGPETATLLELRLNSRANSLPPLLVKCWQLIILVMKVRRDLLQNDWFEIEPQIRRGEHSSVLLERAANILRPKLKLGKRLSLYSEPSGQPERPTDLMSIDYEVKGSISADEVLGAWPEGSTAQTDSRLLTQLNIALRATLEDAIENGVESNEGYSTSDVDVPSVAAHIQNSHRSGFHAIVRVMAELWLRLAGKSPQLAIGFVQEWCDSDLRLMRRIALFACADATISSDFAAEMLVELPRKELFITSSTAEVYRLIRARWGEFDAVKQQKILARIVEGPSPEWFKADSEIDRIIDRIRYDRLSDMDREGLEIGAEGKALLNDIALRRPNWKPRPREQAGFHVWHGSGSSIVGKADKLAGIDDGQLVEGAKKVAEAADFMDGDSWNALCLQEPDRALRGLAAVAKKGDFPVEFWRNLLWVRKDYISTKTERLIGQLLVQWPGDSFEKVSVAASSWLTEHSKTLDEDLLWSLWDRIADATLAKTADMGDA